MDLLSQREAYEFAPAGKVRDLVSPGGFSLLRVRRWHMVLGVRETLIRCWQTQPSQNHGLVSTVMSGREKGSNICCPWSSLHLYPVLPLWVILLCHADWIPSNSVVLLSLLTVFKVNVIDQPLKHLFWFPPPLSFILPHPPSPLQPSLSFPSNFPGSVI